MVPAAQASEEPQAPDSLAREATADSPAESTTLEASSETDEYTVSEEETSDDEFDLSDITHKSKELSREEIIAAAEAAAFA